MTGVLEPITFNQNVDGEIKDLTIPQEFIKDIETRGSHLMIYVRVTGPDAWKIPVFFEDKEDKTFTIKTSENIGAKISDEYILASLYIDEGPHLSADIDIEPPMVRAILDFEKKKSQ